MMIDFLVAEIGSTTTVVNAFIHEKNDFFFLAQGMAKTSVLDGDVLIGLNEAINNLKEKLKVNNLQIKHTLATSSAAGGLKMTVHGLVYDMTVKAAKEAALGAGANIKLITAGKIKPNDLEAIKKIKPNIILIAGGVDYGEEATALYNANQIAQLNLNIPIIYAGNITNQEKIKAIFTDYKQRDFFKIAPNVYPKIDTLVVEPVRELIQNLFEAHIIQAPGMEKVREMINANILPTPGAVMKASELLEPLLGNLITFDVGGATVDIHSVAHSSPEEEKFIVTPEPFAKRTVEGDLGIYLNKDNIINLISPHKLMTKLNITNEELSQLINNYKAIPDEAQIPLSEELTKAALELALHRHVGKVSNIFTPKGRVKIIEGKDLSHTKAIIATGGALTRLPHGKEIINEVINKAEVNILKPQKGTPIYLDHDYILASVGVLSINYPEVALSIIKNSLNLRF